MRIAYIGLSTPLLYDYRYLASKSPSDIGNSPNPILDSPFGLFILFDEIWFLCRSLCPENMRELPYVKFLDEHKLLPSLEGIKPPHALEDIRSDSALSERYNRNIESFSWHDLDKKLGIHWDAGTDNHSDFFRIGNIQTYACPNLNRLFFDIEVVKRLKCKDVELVTNSLLQSLLEDTKNIYFEAKLAEILVIEHIPNYQSPEGPYHPCVEEARDNLFLKDFRKWIVTRSLTAYEEELLDIKCQVEEEIQRLQDKIFLKYLNPKTQYMSAGKTIVGNVLDLILPGLSAATSIAEEAVNFFDRKKKRWQGFIISLRQP